VATIVEFTILPLCGVGVEQCAAGDLVVEPFVQKNINWDLLLSPSPCPSSSSLALGGSGDRNCPVAMVFVFVELLHLVDGLSRGSIQDIVQLICGCHSCSSSYPRGSSPCCPHRKTAPGIGQVAFPTQRIERSRGEV
jgi:hypothetical protein